MSGRTLSRLMKLDDALIGVTQIALDTSPIIYFIEAHTRYDTIVSRIFHSIANGNIVGITSAITLTEVLVQPYRHGNTQLQQQYRDLLLSSDHFHVLPVTSSAAEQAAKLRAR